MTPPKTKAIALKEFIPNNPNSRFKRELTLDFNAVGRAFGVPIWPMVGLLDSNSKEGKRGVPGGVRSLEKEKNYQLVL